MDDQSETGRVTVASCDEPSLLPIADAWARMRAEVSPVRETQQVALPQALDRVLAEPVRATLDVPAQDNSAMDGYALRAADSSTARPLRLLGKSLAGHGFDGEVTEGTCVRITTGGTIPAGAECVVMQENVSANGEQVVINKAAQAGENIRRRGEDIKSGTEILARGHRLGPVDISLLASLGIAQVTVYRRLRIAVLSTGDELAPPGTPLPTGHIYDSNRYGIIAMLQRLSVEVIDVGLVPDQPAAIKAALQMAAQQADAIVSSGGVSVGDADYVKAILSELGQVNFWKVAIKPGKPFAFGKLGNSWFFGLPGNPVSAMVTLHQLALPILQHMAGESLQPPLRIKATAASAFKKRPGRADYQRAWLTTDGNRNTVCSKGAQGSGVLTSFNGANCYVVLEQDRGTVAEGEEVDVLPFDKFLS